MKADQILKGHIAIDEGYVGFIANNFNIKIVSPNPDLSETQRIINCFKDKYNKPETFITGYTTTGHQVSFFLQKNLSEVFFPLEEMNFHTPILIKSSGNTAWFYKNLTYNWELFQAITFYSGNINTIKNPKRAAIETVYLKEEELFAGVRNINIKPFSDYTYKIPICINDVQTEMTISTFSNGIDNYDQREIGFLDSFIRFSVQEPQKFDSIPDYYLTVKKLIAVFTRQNNIHFKTSISQRGKNNLYQTTAHCHINERYKNYKKEFHNKVISLDYFLENNQKRNILVQLIQFIANNKAEHILRLLPSDNQKSHLITINDLANLISALEVEYNDIKQDIPNNDLIEELKERIKETIENFKKENPELDVYQETNIGSAFQYLDYTLKDKIFKLYKRYNRIVDEIIEKWKLPEISLQKIGKMINLRNNALHKGYHSWDGSEQLYEPLLALVYASFFNRIGCDEMIISELIEMLF